MFPHQQVVSLRPAKNTRGYSIIEVQNKKTIAKG
jgi:hypothetical protein